MKNGSVECMVCGSEVSDNLDLDRIPKHDIGRGSLITCPMSGMKWLEYIAILEKWADTIKKDDK